MTLQSQREKRISASALRAPRHRTQLFRILWNNPRERVAARIAGTTVAAIASAGGATATTAATRSDT
jgi:hypothetical protein